MTKGGGTIYFLSGTYDIDSSAGSGPYISLGSADHVSLVGTGTTTFSSQNNQIIELGSGVNIDISHIRFFGTYSPLIYADAGASYIKIHDCYFHHDNSESAIVMNGYGQRNIWLYNNSFTKASGGQGIKIYGENLFIFNNDFNIDPGVAMEVSSNSAFINNNWCGGVLDFSSQGNGYNNSIISNNIFQAGMIRISGGGGTLIIGNNIMPSNNIAIQIDDVSQSCLIVGNRLVGEIDDSSSSAQYGNL